MTPNVAAIVADVRARFALTDVQTTNCRKIAGSTSWSQHSWVNGADLFASPRILDDVATYIRATYSDVIAHVLWKVKDHFTHVHFDTWPQGISTPPCAGGTLKVRHKDGTTGTKFTLDIGDDDMAVLTDAEQKELQDFLKAIHAANSNVGFVTQAIQDVRERNDQGPWAPASHLHAGGGGLSADDVRAIVNGSQIVAPL